MSTDQSKNLTDEQLAKIKAEVAESLARDRHKLICDFPFTGAVAMRLDLVPVRDARVATACTDAKKIYFDCSFYSKLSPKERTFVLAHEIWHCVMMHFARRMTRDVRLFNIATDMEVNYLLKSESNGKSIEPPSEVLFPPKELEGKSAEEIYDYLLKEAEKNQDGSKSGSPGKDGDGQDSSGSQDRDQKNSAESGSCRGQFDKHVEQGQEAGGENAGDSSGAASDDWGEKGRDPDFNPRVSPGAADEMREIASAAAQAAERIQGRLPASVKSLLGKLHKPEIDWKEALAVFVTKTFGDKRQWLPPNRRHVYAGSYFQSRRGDEIRIAVAIDTSGSCLGDLPKFFAELKALVEQNGRYVVDLIQCDASVSSHKTYSDSGEPLEIGDGGGFEVSGGGGTSFTPVFDFIEERGLDPDCLVYFTDGYGDAPPDPPRYPTMWILTSDGAEDFCSWGTKTRFKGSSRGLA